MNEDTRIESELLPTTPRIAIARAGSGEAIMFLHGLGSTKANWYPQLEYFGRTHRALAWDARGYGESDDCDAELSFARDFADDLASVLDFVGVEQAHLVGLSMGGMIAQCFYFSRPTRVASLVLADTFPSFPALGEEAVRAFLAARVEPLENGVSPSAVAPSAVRSLLGPDASEMAKERLMASLSNLRVGPYVKTARAMARQEAVGKLGDITVPTLVVVGELDRLTPLSLATDMAEEIPGAELSVIPRAGHLSNLERPAEFNQAVSAFLSSHG